ncbi:MAG: serine acetyltransferase [Phycisphaerales bacterium]
MSLETTAPQSSRSPAAPTRAISATVPDWSRERPQRFWDPGPRLLKSIRDRQSILSSAGKRPGPFRALAAKLCTLRHRFWSVVSGADIPLTSRIAGGLALPHPSGIVIHPDAVVGPNCCFFQQVTLGVGGPIPGAPIVGGQVDIGAGAKVLGGVRIGDYARIGANAVVLSDVPPGATAVGVPARMIPTP